MHGENPKSKHNADTRNTFGGNIWGWRFSLLGLGLILLMLGIMFFRYMTLPEAVPIVSPGIDTLSRDTNKENR